MNTISYWIDKPDVEEIRKALIESQEKADSITEESRIWEIWEAWHEHGIAQGYIRSLRDSKLLPEPEYSKLFIRQLRIAEKIKALQEVRKDDVCEDTR